jgi:hypothetical protein
MKRLIIFFPFFAIKMAMVIHPARTSSIMVGTTMIMTLMMAVMVSGMWFINTLLLLFCFRRRLGRDELQGLYNILLLAGVTCQGADSLRIRQTALHNKAGSKVRACRGESQPLLDAEGGTGVHAAFNDGERAVVESDNTEDLLGHFLLRGGDFSF